MRAYNLDENLVCTCGHLWKEHRSVPVVNLKYLTYPLAIKGRIANECEYKEPIKRYFTDHEGKKYCMCGSFGPRARNVKILIAEWVNNNK